MGERDGQREVGDGSDGRASSVSVGKEGERDLGRRKGFWGRTGDGPAACCGCGLKEKKEGEVDSAKR
jgi:hypothetical protein